MTAGPRPPLARAGGGRGARRPRRAVADVCCGTGDLALELAEPRRRRGRGDRHRLLREHARDRPREGGASLDHPNVRFVPGDALDLPIGDGEVAAATIAFGMRNLADHAQGFRELVRDRATRAAASSASRSRRRRGAVLGGFYRVWFDRLVPAVGGIVDRGDSAYSYLPASVRRFPGPDELGRIMYAAGLERVRYRTLAGGIVGAARRRGAEAVSTIGRGLAPRRARGARLPRPARGAAAAHGRLSEAARPPRRRRAR